MYSERLHLFYIIMKYKSTIRSVRAIATSKFHPLCPVCGGKVQPILSGNFGYREELIREEFIRNYGVEPIFCGSLMGLPTPHSQCSRCQCKFYDDWYKTKGMLRLTFRAEKNNHWWVVLNADEERRDSGENVYAFEIISNLEDTESGTTEFIKEKLVKFIAEGKALECMDYGQQEPQEEGNETVYRLSIEKDGELHNLYASDENFGQTEPFPFFVSLIEKIVGCKL